MNAIKIPVRVIKRPTEKQMSYVDFLLRDNRTAKKELYATEGDAPKPGMMKPDTTYDTFQKWLEANVTDEQCAQLIAILLDISNGVKEDKDFTLELSRLGYYF